jgi:hypothetical protein
MCHINILSKLDFSRRSAVQFGLKNTLKIPVYRYFDGGISVFGICDIDPLYVVPNTNLNTNLCLNFNIFINSPHYCSITSVQY